MAYNMDKQVTGTRLLLCMCECPPIERLIREKNGSSMFAMGMV